MELEVRGLMSLCKLEFRSASLVIVGVESWLVVRIRCQVRSPPTGGHASVNILSGVL